MPGVFRRREVLHEIGVIVHSSCVQLKQTLLVEEGDVCCDGTAPPKTGRQRLDDNTLYTSQACDVVLE